ncbi:MAG: hypothetical protein ACM3XS_10500 [Bacteroidota bacterium]
MSLVLALQAADGVVLAADSRGTVGDPAGFASSKDTQIKLYRLTDQAGVVFAGAHNLAVNFIEEIKEALAENQRKAYIDDVKHCALEILRDRYHAYFGGPTRDNCPFLAFIFAGYLEEPRQPRIYMMTSENGFAPEYFPEGQAFAGLPQYAIYLVNRLHSPDATLDELTSLAVYAIAETASQEPLVGGPIRVARISRRRGYEEVEKRMIEDILKRGEELNRRLREFFYQKGAGS